jgi:hypothetical protein
MKSFIKAPEEMNPEDSRPTLFLAGTITGAEDWQKSATEYLATTRPDILVINPRQDNFNVKDPTAADKQVEWEHNKLSFADGILFWFPKEGISAITMFELGHYITSPVFIYVGCHPEFWRAFDVNKQLSLKVPNLKVHKTLIDLLWYVEKNFLTKGP